MWWYYAFCLWHVLLGQVVFYVLPVWSVLVVVSNSLVMTKMCMFKSQFITFKTSDQILYINVFVVNPTVLRVTYHLLYLLKFFWFPIRLISYFLSYPTCYGCSIVVCQYLNPHTVMDVTCQLFLKSHWHKVVPPELSVDL